MPSLSSYTPFESLLFFQSLAGLEKRPENFSSISDFLRNHPFIRQDATFDINRLTPQALEELYTDLISGSGSGELLGRKSPEQLLHQNGQQDGLGVSPNPKKRKITPPGDGGSHPTVISGLISRLYARYKEMVTKEIQEEERKYTEIQNEVGKLQKEATQPTPQSAPVSRPEIASKPVPMPANMQQGMMKPGEHKVEYQVLREPGTAPGPLRPAPPALQPKPEPGFQAPVAQDSTRAGAHQAASRVATQYRFSNETPQSMQTYQWVQQPTVSNPPTPLESGGTPIQPSIAIPPFPQPSPNANAAPAVPNLTNARIQRPQQPSPAASARPSPPKSGMQGRIMQPWSIHAVPQTQQPSSPYPSTPQPIAPPPLRPAPPMQLLNQVEKPPDAVPLPLPGPPVPTRPLPPLAKVDNLQAQGVEKPLQSVPTIPTPKAPNANVSVPITPSPLPPRPMLQPLRSRTPWKKLDSLQIPKNLGSPLDLRPENVSPISEPESSPIDNINLVPGKAIGGRKTTPARLKGRSNSPISPSTIQTRRHRRSTTARDPESAGSGIKRELPTTPSVVGDMDLDRRLSDRQTRQSLSVSEDKSRIKRKRIPTETPIPEDVQDSDHVVCTKNFPRTCGPVMNDIAAHKHASIFAKPLTERDAPGYRDIIYRPQDIKSIKSSIHQGSKALAAATEALNASGTDGDSSSTTKGNRLVLKKSADLMPPRSIVNSSQLEKELVRMFANAIMFNPTPETTFGNAFPMRSDSAPREEAQVFEPEEGGILIDALEMYGDVERAVSTWRAAESAVDDLGSKGSPTKA